MRKVLSISLTEDIHKKLVELSKGNISFTIQQILEEYFNKNK